MRADRLLSFLLLLQLRGRMTAAELSRELEVSERTIYRDLEALSLAGIPVYADRGPGGGIALLDSYRTTLTGLTEAEARSLLLLSIPEPLNRLGIGRELKQALRKVLAALPSPGAEKNACAPRVYLDWAGWGAASQSAPHLPALYRALCNNHWVRISYTTEMGILIERTVQPYGLVAKAGIWYLVCMGGSKLSLHRLSTLHLVEVMQETFLPPVEFDLEGYWRSRTAEMESNLAQFCVTVRAAPEILPALASACQPDAWQQADREARQTGQPVVVQLWFESFYTARERLLGCGGAVEILAPENLRLAVIDFARQVIKQYRSA